LDALQGYIVNGHAWLVLLLYKLFFSGAHPSGPVGGRARKTDLHEHGSRGGFFSFLS
jgi:hypothetical protein